MGHYGTLMSIHILLTAFGLSNGSSILAFFPFPIRSHHRAFQPLIHGLLARGHRVTYFTPISLNPTPNNNLTDNYTEILIKDYMMEVHSIVSKTLGGKGDEEQNYFPGIPFQQQLMIIMSGQWGLYLGRFTLKDPNFKEFIDTKMAFDCILYGGMLMQEMYSALSHRFQAPLIEVLPLGNFHYSYWTHGNPFDTSYIVDFSVDHDDNMALLQKIENTFNSLLLRSVWSLYYRSKFEALMNEEIRYPGWESRPSMQELVSNTSMVLMNTHYSLNYPYPLSPNFKEIGGINILQTKPLPKDIQEFMDSATEGVIYFSLGSHIKVSTILADVREAFSAAFSKVKQKVLWKWEVDYPDLPANVKISKWFPQQAILSHKNCKLFITHGGFLSLTESVYHGVPMIGIAILGDQMKNVHHMELHGYGVPLRYNNITEESVSWSINEVINNPKYAENIKKRAEMFRDKPETALETAVYWTEYVIRHKGAHHLRPAIATMPWYQQAMLDVYSAMAALLLIPVYITYKIISCFLKCLCRKSKNGKRKKE